ncbi:hypothetical protein GCM10009795_039970 [Nocardioides hankookensis]|uniref:Uncharacterized protein n=1 Tax=Nocardioides hankookensis TaxID=443157 RepID=A0ABW1LRG9_9ACTN
MTDLLREYEWAFARFLHTPPPLLEDCTYEQLLNGIAYLDRIGADQPVSDLFDLS